MKQTRREFLVTTAVVAGGSALLPSIAGAAPELPARPVMLLGDPYEATVPDGGFRRRSFDDARHYALRFRSTDFDRDREFLGVKI
jgi:hypothetical protein